MERDSTVAAIAYEKFCPRDITVPVEPLLRIQGYRDLQSVRDDVRSIAERMAACAQDLLAPEAYYRRIRIDTCTNGALLLETGISFHSAELTKTMADCRELIAFVLTLGPKLDAKAEALLRDSDVV